MDRNARIARGIGVSAVALFLVAGAAFATDALTSSEDDRSPAAPTASADATPETQSTDPVASPDATGSPDATDDHGGDRPDGVSDDDSPEATGSPDGEATARPTRPTTTAATALTASAMTTRPTRPARPRRPMTTRPTRPARPTRPTTTATTPGTTARTTRVTMARMTPGMMARMIRAMTAATTERRIPIIDGRPAPATEPARPMELRRSSRQSLPTALEPGTMQSSSLASSTVTAMRSGRSSTANPERSSEPATGFSAVSTRPRTLPRRRS